MTDIRMRANQESTAELKNNFNGLSGYGNQGKKSRPDLFASVLDPEDEEDLYGSTPEPVKKNRLGWKKVESKSDGRRVRRYTVLDSTTNNLNSAQTFIGAGSVVNPLTKARAALDEKFISKANEKKANHPVSKKQPSCCYIQ